MASKSIRVIFDTNVWISFLIEYSEADFLVTGDKDLLEHNPFHNTQILRPIEFEHYLSADKRN